VSDPVRACGPCSACCTVIGVYELGKSAYEACRYLRPSGCGIYGDRPRSCRTFECQWLRGVLEVDGTIDTALRPDACGVIFDYLPESAIGEVFTAWEVEPGASAGGQARDIINGLAERFLVVVMTYGTEGGKGVGDGKLVGPPDLVRRASDAMWSR
jgi:hypothetical protein